ncbi:MAG: hypothetical protein MI976_26915 [Pseudomonadales bacterium]|nr:hypothetical protein [Pseudomonadales bacterium]
MRVSHTLVGLLVLVLTQMLSGCLESGPDIDLETQANSGVKASLAISEQPVLPLSAEQAPDSDALYVQFSQSFLARPKERILALLKQANTEVEELDSASDTLPVIGRLLLFGDTPLARTLWHLPEVNATPAASESYVLRQFSHNQLNVYWANGSPANQKVLLQGINRGELYAAYHLLEQLGYHFLHPLQPIAPDALRFNDFQEIREQPRWPIRAWHIHTQHPLELTHVLNGWGKEGPQDNLGWEALLGEWDLFLEWAIANKQNRVEWFLLMADSWQAFADSEERQLRIKHMVGMAHDWGLAVGIDAPIAFKQQHAWTMLREKGNELFQIQRALDWLNVAGFDYFEVEAGFSEFTHPTDVQMLSWLNEVASYSAEVYGKPTYVKVHCTQNQFASSFLDPETAEPLNFNFLPYYADRRLGVLPHTVQFYDLDGPALTYDNENFHYIRRYMQMEAGRREVLFYPETAYWVSFDIDVPLFLPIYMDRRLFDLRLIGFDEEAGRMGRGEHANSRIDGQVNFSSGWEWGYWMNDVVTARAAWNPHLELGDDLALKKSLEPVVAPFGAAREAIKTNIMAWIDMQQRLFIDGDTVQGKPSSPYLRNAQAYLQGWEAWDDVAKTLGMLETQPRKMGLLDMQNPFAPRINKLNYQTELKPLLSETVSALDELYADYVSLGRQVPQEGEALYLEVKDAMAMTLLRARQVFHLYETMANINPIIINADKTLANEHLTKAHRALDEAQQIVVEREANYRVDPDRIAGWGYNPTAYNFGYLWSVRSLHYWWRDEGKVVERPASPGYLNIMDPVDIANGEGDWVEWVVNLSLLRDWLRDTFGDESLIAEMLYEPASEPVYPQNNLRTKPYWYAPVE